MAREARAFAENGGQEAGVRLTQAMVLEGAMCDELSEVKSILLREKKINKFESDKKAQFDLDDLCNVECLIASHNLISDVSGVC